jgi:hypothetical protein
MIAFLILLVCLSRIDAYKTSPNQNETNPMLKFRNYDHFFVQIHVGSLAVATRSRKVHC